MTNSNNDNQNDGNQKKEKVREDYGSCEQWMIFGVVE